MVARRRAGGVNRGLESIELWWQGYSGMSLLKQEVTRNVKALKLCSDVPSIILIHCGGYDLDRIQIKRLRTCIDTIMEFINENFQVKVDLVGNIAKEFMEIF